MQLISLSSIGRGEEVAPCHHLFGTAAI